MQLGSGAITKMYLGATEVTKLYRGSTQIWPAVPPALQFRSDAFNGVQPLQDFWRVYAPNNCTVQRISDGVVTINTDGGEYDNWNTAAPNAPQISQLVPDEDFVLHVEWESILTLDSYTGQGVLLIQDPLNWIRIDMYATDSVRNAFVAICVDGVSQTGIQLNSSIMRENVFFQSIYRTGPSITVHYFVNPEDPPIKEVTFTHTFAINEIGFYGNSSAKATFKEFLLSRVEFESDPI